MPAIHTVLCIIHITPFVPKNSKNFTTFSRLWSRLAQSPDTQNSHAGEQEGFHTQTTCWIGLANAVLPEANPDSESTAHYLKPVNFILWLKELLLTVNNFFALFYCPSTFCNRMERGPILTFRNMPVLLSSSRQKTWRQTREKKQSWRDVKTEMTYQFPECSTCKSTA